MGSFFTNVHVRASGDADTAVTAIVQCLTALATEKGLVPCEDGATVDRGFLVGATGAWVGIHDQASESQDVDLLDDLARRLSLASGGPALATLVHDSDHVLLRLFERGELADAVEAGKKKPKMDVWARLVEPDALPSLRKAFAARDLFSEQTVADVAAVLGIPEQQACAGYKYLLEDGAVPPGMTHLRFRRAVRPIHEQLIEGPPRLVSFGGMRAISLAVGGTLSASGAARDEGGSRAQLLSCGPRTGDRHGARRRREAPGRGRAVREPGARDLRRSH